MPWYNVGHSSILKNSEAAFAQTKHSDSSCSLGKPSKKNPIVCAEKNCNKEEQSLQQQKDCLQENSHKNNSMYACYKVKQLA